MDILGLRESLFSAAHRFLLCDAADPGLQAVCRNSLRRLGFDVQRLDDLPIGIFPSPLAMKEGLLQAGFRVDEIAASGLVSDPRVAARLIGPIRNTAARILSFWARHPEGTRPKYLFLGRSWKEETPAFGLDVAMPRLTDAARELLLTEDLLDALLLQSAGLPQVAATLGFAGNLTPARWEQFAILGVKRVTLVPGDEEKGLARAALAREAALRGSPAPEVFVLLPERFGRVNDLAEMIRAMSREAFWFWLRNSRVPRTDDRLATASNMGPAAEYLAESPGLSVADGDSSGIGLCPFHHCDPMFCFCWD
jgi:hypothetical protein